VCARACMHVCMYVYVCVYCNRMLCCQFTVNTVLALNVMDAMETNFNPDVGLDVCVDF